MNSSPDRKRNQANPIPSPIQDPTTLMPKAIPNSSLGPNRVPIPSQIPNRNRNPSNRPNHVRPNPNRVRPNLAHPSRRDRIRHDQRS